MTDPLNALGQQLTHGILTVVMPLALLAMVVGVLMREGLEAFGKWLGGAIRGRREKGRAAVYSQMTNDEVLDAPHCPKCNGLMVLRKAGRGAHVGESFWGCNSFPKCRGTRRK
jgi:hypothetical protein